MNVGEHTPHRTDASCIGDVSEYTAPFTKGRPRSNLPTYSRSRSWRAWSTVIHLPHIDFGSEGRQTSSLRTRSDLSEQSSTCPRPVSAERRHPRLNIGLRTRARILVRECCRACRPLIINRSSDVRTRTPDSSARGAPSLVNETTNSNVLGPRGRRRW